MPLRFNTLLKQEGIAPEDVWLLRHQDKRSEKGKTPYELWRYKRSAFEHYQRAQSPTNGPRLKAPYWASFVVSRDGDTLLAGFYSCVYQGPNTEVHPWAHAEGQDEVGTRDTYQLIPDKRLADLVGRLVIDWGASEKAWIQRSDRQDKIVLQITKDDPPDPPFPGAAHFVGQLSRIEGLPLAWKAVLSNSKGVYLLTCPTTREQYVGSAYGEDGFLGRWLTYAHDGHGGNVALKSRKPSDYRVSILEVAGSLATINEVLKMESVWKQKLQSFEMGLNRNK